MQKIKHASANDSEFRASMAILSLRTEVSEHTILSGNNQKLGSKSARLAAYVNMM